MASDTDSDVPDSGAAFTFGKSRFAGNLPGKFWIRDDPILQVACGDEHTAFLTASGRVFTFGHNEWGQLGHGHTNSLTKPSCVKALKHERATVLACGRSHTLVATDMGHIYGFGTNGEGQLGSAREYATHTAPVRLQGLEDVTIKMLCGGADHSIALTDKGILYVWGSNSEGQIALQSTKCAVPTELKFDSCVICVSAGYYHTSFVTVDGKLYTCGENDCGKLGVPDVTARKNVAPHHVAGIDGKVVWTSCGGNHTVALTADGKAYSFGSGFNGQLGLGSRILEASAAHRVSCLENVKIARVSCGENHTGFLTDTGHIYTCGDRRHGKLGLLDDNDDICCNQFVPTLVARFQGFQVQQIACGGCHTLVLAVKTKSAPTSPRNFSPEDGDVLFRTRERPKNTQLPPLSHISSPSSFQSKKIDGSVSSLKHTNRMRLPSLSKSPVWYVPLEKVAGGSKNPDQNSDDENEVLSKFEQRCSFLDDIEDDESIRHVDSDVESDCSEVTDLNRTHTLVRIDNTISIVRPVVPDVSDKGNRISLGSEKFNRSHEETQVKEIIGSATKVKAPTSQFFLSPEAKFQDNRLISNEKEEILPADDDQINNENRKSQFYDHDDSETAHSTKSGSSKNSKSSKACVLF